jgi:hypothetical protein
VPRKPTHGDLLKLRRLLEKASSDAEFRRWFKLAKKLPKGKQGRRKIPNDDAVLPYLPGYLQFAKAAGLPPMTALRLAAEIDKAAHPGTSPTAVAARLYRKLKARKLRKR